MADHVPHWEPGVREVIARERAAATAELRAELDALIAVWEVDDLGTDRHCAADLRRLLDEVAP